MGARVMTEWELKGDTSGPWDNEDKFLPAGESWVIAESDISVSQILICRAEAVQEVNFFIFLMTSEINYQ